MSRAAEQGFRDAPALPVDPPVLVVVLNDPADLARARDEGWYRIPLARAPRRIAAEYLAFYQTAAFPQDERWSITWLAPVHGYHVATRGELIPAEPDHPRAGELYYRVVLGPLEALPHPVPSRRLRRITFIATTLSRLLAAGEINDLWHKSTAQERLWCALKALDVGAERQYPLSVDDPDAAVADFAVPLEGADVAGTALIVEDENGASDALREAPPRGYALLACRGWRVLRTTRAELSADPEGWARRLAGRPEAERD